MKGKKLWIVLGSISIMLAALIIVVLIVPGQAPETFEPLRQKKVFRLMAGEPPTLDPQIANDVLSAMYVLEIYSGLLTLVPVPVTVADRYIEERELPVLGPKIVENMPEIWQEWVKKNYLREGVKIVLAPDIAKEIPRPILNSDGTVSYIFRLRENVYFHNGRKVTAHDFKWSFERAADPRGPDRASIYTLPTADLYLSDIVGVRDKMRGKAEQVSGVKVLDDYTLKITIDSQKTYFLWKMSYPTAFVIDRDQIVFPEGHPRAGEPLGLDWTSRPNGTGPFRLEDKTFQEIVLVRNENFYLDPPLIDKVVINLEGGTATAFYQEGKIHQVGIGLEDLERLGEFKGQYFSRPEMGTWYIAFNTARPPFDCVNLRRAFAHAIDLDIIEQVVLRGILLRGRGILPPGMPGFRPDFKGIAYDLEKAKQYLRASQYYDPVKQAIVVEGREVKITLMRAGGGPAPGYVLTMILDMWSKLGITVGVDDPRGFTAFQEQLRLGNFQITLHGWISDYPDPENFLDLLFHSERKVENRITRYNNPEFDHLIELARVEQDKEKRIKLYQMAEDILMRELPWIPLFYTHNSLMVSPLIKGYFPMPMVIPFFRYIDMEIDREKE